jgi:hypothetical protein
MYYQKSPSCRHLCLLLFLALGSCTMEEISTEFQENSLSNTFGDENVFSLEEMIDTNFLGESLRLGTWNMIIEETFEGAEPFYAYVHKQMGAEHSLTTASSPKLLGKNSGRFELRITDPIVTTKSHRSEVLFPRAEQNNVWYSFGVYLPSNGFANDKHHEVLTQWIDNGQRISLRTQNGNFRLRFVNNDGSLEHINLGAVTKDKWHEFVFHIIHSNGSDGLTELWLNGKKIVNRKGPNNSSGQASLWKLGIYKSSWTKENSNTTVRVAYFDNIRMANQNSNFEEMKPSNNYEGDWGPFIPSVGKLTLINAHTNQEIKTIENGEVISTAMLNTNRISIKADLGSEFQGSVGFDLKGPKSNLVFDNFAPFAMFSDDGNGNYFNGGGLPLGDYTLTITPSDERNGRGKLGQPKVIKFKVVDTEIIEESIPNISSFTLITANTNRKWGTITDGQVISLESTKTDKLTIEAEIPSTFKGSVRFELTGRVNRISSATIAPYTLYNFKDGNYTFGGTGLPIGEYSLTATPSVEKNGKILFGVPKTIRFKVVESSSELVSSSTLSSKFLSATLIKANTNTEWGIISDGMKLSVSELGTHKLTVRANMVPTFTGRVLFELSGTVNRTSSSSTAPYTLNNYKDGNYTFGNGLPVGSYTLKITPFENIGGNEIATPSTILRFQIN